jgi:hypothetical protein
MVIYEKFELWGHVGGNVTVISGGKFYLRGAIYGNLIVEDGGRVHIFGQIKGNVTLGPNTKVIHSGVVGGDIINNGGRLFVDRASKVGGKIRTRSGGETKHEGAPPPPSDLPTFKIGDG